MNIIQFRVISVCKLFHWCLTDNIKTKSISISYYKLGNTTAVYNDNNDNISFLAIKLNSTTAHEKGQMSVELSKCNRLVFHLRLSSMTYLLVSNVVNLVEEIFTFS